MVSTELYLTEKKPVISTWDRIRLSYCTPTDITELRYHSDLMKALDEIERLNRFIARLR